MTKGPCYPKEGKRRWDWLEEGAWVGLRLQPFLRLTGPPGHESDPPRSRCSAAFSSLAVRVLGDSPGSAAQPPGADPAPSS